MPDRFPTGTRIRERRLERGMQQVDLAAAAGISASYLNLIEHNRRRIAGKLLRDIARALQVDPAILSQGSEPGRIAALRALGAAQGMGDSDLARVEDMIARFPAWAGLIEAQGRQNARLEARVAELSDRLEHDPALARALHEVLSRVTAIHATSSIMVDEGDLDRDWQRRFSRNIHDESRKLTEASRALVQYLDRPTDSGPAPLDPRDEASAWLAGQGAHVPAIEAGADPRAVARDAGLSAAASWILRGWLDLCAGDARALPLGPFAALARAQGWDPVRLTAATAAAPARVLRRLAALAPAPGQPPMALALADGGGALLHVTQGGGFGLPALGACPLWPVFAVLSQPGRALVRRVQMPGPGGATWLAHAVAEPAAEGAWEAAPHLLATMLVTRTDAGEGAPVAVGRTCRVCPRDPCGARREPSVLGPLPADSTL